MSAAVTLIVRIALPEGVTLDTSEYYRAHGHPRADQPDRWGFAPADLGLVLAPLLDDRPAAEEPGTLWLSGTLIEVLDEVPRGEWRLLP